MCIYYGNKDNLKYTKREHVIPAGLGCHTTLPIGAVSDQANDFFSPIERRVMEQSMVQVSRIIKGPGKRGSLSLEKATTSSVSAIEIDGDISLGYIKRTEAFILNQFVLYNDNEQEKIRYVQGNESTIPREKTDYIIMCEDGMNQLIKKLKKWDDFYRYVQISADYTIVTYFKDEIYVGAKIKPSDNRVNTIKSILCNDFAISKQTSKIRDGRPTVAIEIKHSFTDTARIAAKTAINTLTYLLDSERVSSFIEIDPLRNAIISENDSILEFVREIPDARELKKSFSLGEDTQSCLLMEYDQNLYSYVFFYDHGFCVNICKNPPFDIGMINGIVCEWKKRKDYMYYDYLHTTEGND